MIFEKITCILLLKVTVKVANQPKEDGENSPSQVETGEKYQTGPSPFSVDEPSENANKTPRSKARNSTVAKI